jgi:hypothetical protein
MESGQIATSKDVQQLLKKTRKHQLKALSHDA